MTTKRAWNFSSDNRTNFLTTFEFKNACFRFVCENFEFKIFEVSRIDLLELKINKYIQKGFYKDSLFLSLLLIISRSTEVNVLKIINLW